MDRDRKERAAGKYWPQNFRNLIAYSIFQLLTPPSPAFPLTAGGGKGNFLKYKMFFSMSHILVNFTKPLLIRRKRCVKFFFFFPSDKLMLEKPKIHPARYCCLKFTGKDSHGDKNIYLSSQIYVRPHEITQRSSLLQRNRNFIPHSMITMLRPEFCNKV